MKRVLLAALVVALVSVPLCGMAQAPPAAPKPGPEHARLKYFLGKWTWEADMKANPFMPAGKSSGSETWEWFPGGFFLVSQSEGKGPMGEEKGRGVLGYNSEEKVYTYYGYNNHGMGDFSRGSLKGNTWTWTSESKMGGKLIKSRFVIKEVSPTMYTFWWETSADGTTWSKVMEGKATRAK